MRTNLANNKSDVNFKATIIYNRKLIMQNLKKDKKLTQIDYSIISDLLDNVDSFSKLKENSVVEISPRINSGQVNLISKVYDANKKIFDIVSERSVRKLINNLDFRNKYLQSISSLIKNIEQTKNGIDEIAKTVINSNNIKGVIIKSKKESLTLENIHKCFEDFSFRQLHIDSLNKGYNPTDKIIKLINNIDKKSHEKDIYIGIVKKKEKKSMAYFKVETIHQNNAEQKEVLLSELFKIPLEDRLTTTI